RALRGLRIAIGLSTAFGVVMFYTAFFHGDLLCAIFAKDREIILAGFDYLRAYAIDCLFTCFLFCFIGFYNGLGRTAFVMAQGIGAAFLIRIPVAYLMSVRTGRLFYIGLSVPCSTIVQITVCFLFLEYVKKRGLMAGEETQRQQRRGH
ncbi:MAG: MATE family efflux transporter, partial [Ruminococcaceae bacterium]|nr:MATE family efflux transporter [Oscillospiraceae bacterium]